MNRAANRERAEANHGRKRNGELMLHVPVCSCAVIEEPWACQIGAVRFKETDPSYLRIFMSSVVRVEEAARAW